MQTSLVHIQYADKESWRNKSSLVFSDQRLSFLSVIVSKQSYFRGYMDGIHYIL